MDFATKNLGRVRSLVNGKNTTTITADSPIILTQVGTNMTISAPTLASHLTAINPHGITPQNIGAAVNTDFQSHANDQTNPHGVTKAQLGLENVANKTPQQILAELSLENVAGVFDENILFPRKVGPGNPIQLTMGSVGSYLENLIVDISPDQFIIGSGTPSMAGESYGHMIFGKTQIADAMVAVLGSQYASESLDYLDYYATGMQQHDGEFLYQIEEPVPGQQYSFVWYGKTYDDLGGKTGLAFKYSDGSTQDILSLDEETGFITNMGGLTVSDSNKTLTGIVFKYNSDTGDPAMQMSGSGFFDYDIRDDVNSSPYAEGSMAVAKYAIWVIQYTYENILQMSSISSVEIQKKTTGSGEPTETFNIVLDKEGKFAGGLLDAVKGVLYTKFRVQEITSSIPFQYVKTTGDYSLFKYVPSSENDPFGDMPPITSGNVSSGSLGFASTHYPCDSVCSEYVETPTKLDIAVVQENGKNAFYIGAPGNITVKSDLDNWIAGQSSPMKIRYPVMGWSQIPGRIIPIDVVGQYLASPQASTTLKSQYFANLVTPQ